MKYKDIFFILAAVFLVFALASVVRYGFVSHGPGVNHIIDAEKVPSQGGAGIKTPETDHFPAGELSFNFIFFGDVMLDRHVGEKIRAKGLDYLLEELAASPAPGSRDSFFSQYDIVGCNLEGSVTKEGRHYPPAAVYDFAFEPSVVEKLKKYNFNFFNLANNHFADQGKRGIMETRKHLVNQGYWFAGCADRQVGSCSTSSLQIKGKRIGMAGFSMVYGNMEEKKAAKAVNELARESDLVIVNMHWGEEYEHRKNAIQRRVAHFLIDNGADIIVGHHPHVVQGVGVYKQKPIFYSLGNFIFDQYFSQATQEGLAVAFNIREKKIKATLFPLISSQSRVRLLKKNDRVDFFQKLAKWSDELPAEYKEMLKEGRLDLLIRP